jgi:hypothetical protein
MGVGYIQLVTKGNEFNIFNKEPEITFFKIYYRRHSNFFINNFEINGNDLKNGLLTYKIPKNGDLLGKSYLKIKFNEYYVELFKQYSTLYSSLNTNILNFYNSYSIRVNYYNKNLINNIEIIKINFKYLNLPFITIMCTNIINTLDLTELIKMEYNCFLETDELNIFYNINMNYLFYGFNFILTSNNFLSNNVILYLINQIQYINLQYIRVDFLNYNLSIKIKIDFEKEKKYFEIINFIINNTNNTDTNLNIKINKYDVYLSIFYNTDNTFQLLLNLIFNLIFNNTDSVNVEIINNKIKSIKFVINTNVSESLKNIFFKIDSNYYLYYDIIYDKTNTMFTLYTLKDTTYFGNLTSNDFNESLISNETTLISIVNLSNATLPINLYIRLLVSIICNKNNSIQEYIKIINSPNYLLNKRVALYIDNIAEFNKKILDIIINPQILILSKNTFRRILYQNNIKNTYEIKNTIKPFTNRKITIYENIILNYYLYYNILSKCSNKYNSTYDIFSELLLELIYLASNNFTNSITKDITYNNLINYFNNNNLLTFINNKNTSISITNLFYNTNENSMQTLLIQNLAYNYVLICISESFKVIANIYNKLSNSIYNTNGQLTNLFFNNTIANSIFPLSSCIYIYLNDVVDGCPTTQKIIPYDISIFNTDFTTYITNLIIIIRNIFIQNYNLYQNNFNQQLNFNQQFNLDSNYLINNPFLSNELINTFKIYYKNISNNNDAYDVSIIKQYFDVIENVQFYTNFSTDYNIKFTELNDFVLLNLFTYVDNSLFNNSFSSYTYYLKICGKTPERTNFINQKNYLRFTFIVNSPMYRIYYLYTFLEYLNHDTIIKLTFPVDLVKLKVLLIKFILEFIKDNNNINFPLTNIIEKVYNVINVNLVYDTNINVINNFLSYDKLDIFNLDSFKYLLSLNNDNSYIFLFTSFYFNKIIINKNSINEFIYEYKYNYDDKIIILLLNILNINKENFLNYDNIYELVNTFFNKSQLNFDKIINELIEIYKKTIFQPLTVNNFSELINNKFYYNCYYTIYNIGIVFDNTNLNNINTINNIYNLTTNYNTYSNNMYNYKGSNVKQFVNIINNNNITDGLIFINSLYSNILASYNLSVNNYYNIFINSIDKYISNNIQYLSIYLFDEIIFKQCYNRIIYYLNKYNQVNNSNITLLDSYPFTNNTFNNNTFNNTSVLIIYLLYISFINKCLNSDIQNFTILNLNENLNTYIISLYSINLYTECLNDLITYTSYINNANGINLNYSAIPVNKLNNINNQFITNTSIKYNFEKIYLNEDITTNKIYYNLLNKYSNIYVTSTNIYTNNYNDFIYNIYNDLIQSFLSQYNKLLFSIIDTNILNKTNSINELSNLNIEINYDTYLNNIYNNSLFIIENNIYNNLLNSSTSIQTTNTNIDNAIINNLLTTIKYFYNINNTTNNYFNTIYYKNITQPDNNVINLISYYSNYLNNTIISSLFYEKELNRIIYLLCTNYVINLSINKIDSINYIKSHTLYNIVKLYINNETEYKIYLSNTSLYENIDIFELFNYNNWSDDQSFMQNKYINKIINDIEIEPTNTNSYYYYYNIFKTYVINKYPEITNFKLNNNIPVIEYFANINNISELHEFIFNYLTLNDNFCPNYIYNSIITFKYTNELSSYLTIELDIIKKKIIIFLFFNYLIFSRIHVLLINEFNYNKNIILEYNINGEIITFSLNTILENPINKNIINYVIYKIYAFDDNNINNKVNVLDDSILFAQEIIYLTINIMNNVSISNNFIILCKNYINSYYINIGNNNINSTSTITPYPNNTITNLVERINVIFNNDYISTNPKNIDLTIYSFNLLNIRIENIIFDLNNIIDNKFYTSSVIDNIINTYKDTNISNINILFNLVCSLLGNYNITYPNINNDMNLIIGNIRLGAKYINNILENFKGVTTNYQISQDLVNYNNILTNNNIITNILSRAYNINYLSNIANNFNNLSIITPNDYDLTINNFNFKKIYEGFYNKYYSYTYNYYNIKNNYTVIYAKLLSYYELILENATAIINLQKNDINLYKIFYNNIVNTNIATKYYLNDMDPSDYLYNFNKIIEIYKKFNFIFILWFRQMFEKLNIIY